jgi:hypothetical protein
MEAYRAVEKERFKGSALQCVARYLEKQDTIRCGKPGIPWNNESCFIREHERIEKEMSGRCKSCRSIEIARQRAAKQASA